MPRHWWFALPAVVGAFALGYWVAPRSKDPRVERTRGDLPAPRESKAPTPAPSAADYLGVILARDSIDVSAPAAGRLEAVPVEVGDVVRAGAVVARLESKGLANDLAMAEAALGRIRSEREKAALELEQARDRSGRLQRLWREAGVVSQEDLSSAQYQEKLAAARLSGTDANVREQQTRVAQLRDALAEVQMRAPFTGEVANRYRDTGATVAQGERVVRIISTDKLLVRFAVPEEEARQLVVRDPVRVRIEEHGLEIVGEISGIAPDVDPPSQAVFAEAVLTDSAGLKDSIVVGRAVRVSLPGGRTP